MGAAVIAAVEGMTRALALDLAPIRVNAVAPGIIDTPLWDSFREQRAAILALGANLPVKRVGRPEEVAATGRCDMSIVVGVEETARLDLVS